MVIFDLDDTLAASKSPIAPDMAQILGRLLAKTEVCIISGGNFAQFDSQVIRQLSPDVRLAGLHLMPTCGTRYLRYVQKDWQQLYAHDLAETEKQQAVAAITEVAQRLGYWEPDEKLRGERIEDRGSQITYSALGQQALVEDKKNWDPTGIKRRQLQQEIAVLLPDLEVRAGGSTSIDITRCGIDKAYGVRQLAEQTGIDLAQMLFVGDRLEPGGNDYPVKALGLACQEVSGPSDTIAFLTKLLDNAWR